MEPVLRCDSCNTLVELKVLHKLGSCSKCGNKRVKSLTIFNDEERAQIESWGHTDFLKEFETVDESA